MADDNNTNKIGATVVYDSQHALDAAKAYKQQIANQLGHKLKNRPYSAAEQKRNTLGTKLLEATLGKGSLPKNYGTSLPSGTTTSNDWLGSFYAENNIGGPGGNLDTEARNYWENTAADKGIYETKKIIEGTAKNQGTWGTRTPSSGGIKTDSFLKRSGGDYKGWHSENPVNMSGDLDDDAWVRGAYRSLLGREADDGGLAYWKGALASGQSRDDVVSNFRRQPEYRDKFIGEAYQNLFGRPADVGGNDYWSKAMEGGASEDDIIGHLKRSDEFGRLQQTAMRDAITPKDPLDIMNEAYDEDIATQARAYQVAQDAVQKEYNTPPDYSPFLTTDSTIYTQDPEASSFASLNYLASQDPSKGSPGIWTRALKDAGAKALEGIDIPGLVSGFFDTRHNIDPGTFASNYTPSSSDSSNSDWLGDFYKEHNIGGPGGVLDQAGRDYWTGEYENRYGGDLWETKKAIEKMAKGHGTWQNVA